MLFTASMFALRDISTQLDSFNMLACFTAALEQNCRLVAVLEAAAASTA